MPKSFQRHSCTGIISAAESAYPGEATGTSTGFLLNAAKVVLRAGGAKQKATGKPLPTLRGSILGAEPRLWCYNPFESALVLASP